MPSEQRRRTVILISWLMLSALVEVAEAQNAAEEYVVAQPHESNDGPDECLKPPNIFNWADYLVLGSMLVISCGIGLFYGCFGKKQTTSNDFLLGGSDMGTVPMALSLTTSFITAIELLGNPAEVYTNGTQFWLIVISFIIVLPIASSLFLPVFSKLELTSCYEYLGLRFDKSLRMVGSLLYILMMVLYTSVAVYAPALALSHVTGLNTYLAVTLVYVVCIFYASQGGMKAVVVADSFQAVVLLGSLLLVLFLGLQVQEDSWSKVWDMAQKNKRIEFLNLDPRPSTRHTVWSVVIGGSFYWASMFCTNQASVQKYQSVGSLRKARTALWVSCIGLILVFSINFLTGLVMHSNYAGCDPLKTGEISASDQLLPLYVMQVLGHIRGVPGFFVAGIFAASLGTVASALNSLSAVTCDDLLGSACGYQIPPAKGALWAKWMSLGYGVLSFALVFVVERLGSVLQVALSFNGMAGGVTLGMFVLGMCYPRANAKGALTGAITALAFVLWIGLGAQVYGVSPTPLPTAIDECHCSNNTSTEELLVEVMDQTDVFPLYRISYLWYGALGCIFTLCIGIVTSEIIRLFSSDKEKELRPHPDLLSPPISWLMGNNVEATTEKQDHAKEPRGEINRGLDLDEGRQ